MLKPGGEGVKSIVGRFAVGAGLGVHFLELALEVFVLAFETHDLVLEVCDYFIKLAELVLHVGEIRLNLFFKIHSEIVSNQAIKVK